MSTEEPQGKEIDGIRFPLEFRCQCGSSKRIVETIANRQKEAGRLPKGLYPGTSLRPVAIGDPTGIALSFPAVQVVFDICADCGREYACRVFYMEVPAAMFGPGLRPKGDHRFGA